ncbi:MAG TPA: AraC family transcriptional regulator [Victivallales bacterium]|nr:AraC family transcriptional regulator [Victivallales bacterium]
MLYYKVPDTGDPSSVNQNFSRLQVNLLCCHYWVMDVWEHNNLSFPYWRLYWNNKAGAKISFQGVEYKLIPEKIYLIPPYTAYSTHYDPDRKAPANSDFLLGESINSYIINNKRADLNGKLKHFFVHFSLGLPYDAILPQILEFNISSHVQLILDKLIPDLNEDYLSYDRYVSMLIYSLILELLNFIPKEKCMVLTTEPRIEKIIKHIDNNLASDLSNVRLAKIIHMSTNAFSRLFLNEVGRSPQKYILKRRIEKACIILHYSSDSIDSIAHKTGFCDRFYFSRMFKKKMNVSPVAYRHSFKF